MLTESGRRGRRRTRSDGGAANQLSQATFCSLVIAGSLGRPETEKRKRTKTKLKKKKKMEKAQKLN